MFPFDPLHTIFILVEEHFMFPIPHPIEECLQAHGVDSTTLVKVAI
jgi:hypothetical protein